MYKILADAVRSPRIGTLNWIRRFMRTENGVMTVEWVALAACMVVGAVVISFMVMHSLSATAQSIGAQLTTP